MKRLHRFPATVLFLIGAWLIDPLTLCAQEPVEELGARLARLLERLPDAQTEVSACVLSLPDGRVVYQRQADQPVVPASNQKILSGAVALSTLGEKFRFRTELALQGPDLVLVGGGDPALGDPRLAAENGLDPLHPFVNWAAELKARGMTSIAGDILVHDQAFEHTWVHPSWPAEDLSRWYAAPVGALNFNNNCIEATVWPTAKGRPARYSVFPKTAWVEIENQCKTGPKNKPWILRRGISACFSLEGECSQRSELAPVAVPDPGIFTGTVFKEVLHANGISVAGNVRRPARPADPQRPEALLPVATHTTPMQSILKRALGDSQNLFAECLIKAIARGSGQRSASPPRGSWEAGSALAVRTVKSWGIDTAGMVIADGSGLSRDNRATARQIVQILKHMYMDAQRGDLFIESLSLNGTHGTLRKRMSDIAGQVWAKSGYLRGIRSLSGYVRASDQQWYAFSVLFNDVPGPMAPYNHIHDSVCRTLANAAPTGSAQ